MILTTLLNCQYLHHWHWLLFCPPTSEIQRLIPCTVYCLPRTPPTIARRVVLLRLSLLVAIFLPKRANEIEWRLLWLFWPPLPVGQTMENQSHLPMCRARGLPTHRHPPSSSHFLGLGCVARTSTCRGCGCGCCCWWWCCFCCLLSLSCLCSYCLLLPFVRRYCPWRYCESNAIETKRPSQLLLLDEVGRRWCPVLLWTRQ